MVKGEIPSDGIFDEMPPWAKADMPQEKAALQQTECQEAAHQEVAQQKVEKGKNQKEDQRRRKPRCCQVMYTCT